MRKLKGPYAKRFHRIYEIKSYNSKYDLSFLAFPTFGFNICNCKYIQKKRKLKKKTKKKKHDMIILELSI